MATITVNGNTYSTAGEATRDMRNYGYTSWLFPLFNDTFTEIDARMAAGATAISAVRYDTASQGLTTTQKNNSLTNIGLSALTTTSGVAKGVAYLNASGVVTTGTGLVFDGSNLGVGVAPSAWGGSYKVLENSGGAFVSSGTGYVGVGQNYYNNGTSNLYKNTAAATLLDQTGGQFRWFTAPSGTAGNPITFTQAMTLDTSGNLLVGVTSGSTRLHIQGSGDVARFTNGTNSAYLTPDSQGFSLFSGAGQTGSGIYANHTSSAVSVFTNGSEKVKVDSSGNLLVGTTTASGLAQKTVELNATNNASIAIKASDTIVASLYGDSTTNEARITAHGSRSVTFHTNSTERGRFDASGNHITKFGQADQSYSYQTPATGFSITLSAANRTTILEPSGTLATGTITMPASPVDGQKLTVSSTQTITALTVSPNAGQTIKNAPTTLAAGGSFTYIYRSTNTTWYKIG